MQYYGLKENQTFLISVKGFVEKDDKILLLKNHPGDYPWSNKWALPGGLVEFDENMKVSLLREINEEVKIKVKIRKLFTVTESKYNGFILKDRRKMNVHYADIFFICEHLSGEVKISDEHISFEWVDKEDLNKYQPTPQIKEAYLKYAKTYKTKSNSK